MAIFTILLLLGTLCLLIGTIVLIVGGFQQSIGWGLAVLFLPLAGLIFLFVHWEKGKNGFLLMVTGVIFYVAGYVAMPPNAKPALAAIVAARTGQPIPTSLSGLFGAKPAPPDARGGAPAPAAGKVGSTAPAAALPGATAVTAPNAPASLDNEAQVLAAVAELNDRAKPLMGRKEALKNSADQPAIFALAEDIKAFNERLKVVTTRQAELNQAKTGVAPAASTAPTPSPAPTMAPGASPVIPSTVVIPASTPAPKKK